VKPYLKNELKKKKPREGLGDHSPVLKEKTVKDRT
jgi:hypothetical protein